MPFNTFISQPKSSLVIHSIMFKHSSLFSHQLIHMIRPPILSFQSIIIHYCLRCKQAISGLMISYKFTPIQQIDMHSGRNPRRYRTFFIPIRQRLDNQRYKKEARPANRTALSFAPYRIFRRSVTVTAFRSRSRYRRFRGSSWNSPSADISFRTAY